DHGSGQMAEGGHRDGTFAPATLAGHATPATQTHRDLFPHDVKPLAELTRNQMQSRFQFDFSRVRIHHAEEASRAATALSARAFTLGNDIAFGREEYSPHNPNAQRLLPHELAHVVQQAHDPAPV